ncbi:MAG: outer membrane protein assembly factor BamD [Bacteroidales bacterium]|nr:outer membrane protein assembly factor BamD [Bacteroidales bacterium]
MSFIAVCSCKSQYELLLEGADNDAKYAAAFDYFNKAKYTKASALFESLAAITTGTERDDTVQFYWGLSNYSNKDYVTAESNFDHFLSVFPRSTFAEQAEYLKVDCLYKATLRYELDQTPTYKAISAIGEYIVQHPDGVNAIMCQHMLEDLGNRLDRKAYENARIYYVMEDYKAARVALKNVLKDDADNVYREDILYYAAMSSYKYADMSIPSKQKERFLVFIDDYYNFIGEYPDSDYRKGLDVLYNKVKDK